MDSLAKVLTAVSFLICVLFVIYFFVVKGSLEKQNIRNEATFRITNEQEKMMLRQKIDKLEKQRKSEKLFKKRPKARTPEDAFKAIEL